MPLIQEPVPISTTLDGRIAVVIGGGRGIGRATALTLASAGAQVIVAARTAAELNSVAAEIESNGDQAAARPLDITQSRQVQAFADELCATYGRVDILVNSAGASFIGSLDDSSEADWDRMIDTNLKGPYLCIRAMLDLLRASESPWVINLASKVGLTGFAQVSAYTAAKSGLVGFGRALAQELGAENIRVITLCPGPVDTPMRWAATPDLDPNLTIPAETVAETILFLVSLDSRVTVRSELVMEALGYQESAVHLGH